MRYWLIVLLLICFAQGLRATHIVGGGFAYSRVQGNDYRFTLTLYFDEINGNQGALDGQAMCHIFRKFDNNYMDSVLLPLVSSEEFLNYTNPNCGAIANVATRVLVYSAVFTLPDDRYNSAKGYYMIWERCCRNNIITNITFPEDAGQTFYMEFPPVFRNGQPYINSSPQFAPILADFPCINQDYSISFTATDADGDQLLYTMTDPLAGNATSVSPLNNPPEPAPYDPVDWIQGFSANQSIPGNPPLNVNQQTGILSCKASMTGLFVFSVKCEEFRNGVKIGEVRREMQLPVVDCPPNDPPVIVVNNPQGFRLGEDDTLSLETMEENFCIPLKLTDIQENTEIKFNLDVVSGPSNLEYFNQYLLAPGNDSADAEFCLPACSFTQEGEYWKIRLRATDNGCPEAFTDTLEIYLSIRKTPLLSPEISFKSNLPDTIVFKQSEFRRFPVRAEQPQDVLLSVVSSLLDSQGQEIFGLTGVKLPGGNAFGQLDTALSFTGICNLPPDGILKITSIVNTYRCQDTLSDTISRIFKIIPDEPKLILTSDWTGPSLIQLGERENVSFTVSAKMSDSSQIEFLLASGPLTFQPGFQFSTRGSASGTVFGDFTFASSCEGDSGLLPVKFSARRGTCNPFKPLVDSLNYQIKLSFEDPELRQPPNLITVNGDGRNDYFSLPDVAPLSNCASEFDYIEIFNRWGNRIHFEKGENFYWKPDELTEGLFFYTLHFKRRKPFTGWIQVVKDAR